MFQISLYNQKKRETKRELRKSQTTALYYYSMFVCKIRKIQWDVLGLSRGRWGGMIHKNCFWSCCCCGLSVHSVILPAPEGAETILLRVVFELHLETVFVAFQNIDMKTMIESIQRVKKLAKVVLG